MSQMGPGSRPIMLKLSLVLAGVILWCNPHGAAAQGRPGNWAWMGGSKLVSGCSPQANCPAAAGVYGTEYLFATTNFPGSRSLAVTWTDAKGKLWLFGGTGYDSLGNYGQLNDLWAYLPPRAKVPGEWAWMGGSTTVNATGLYGIEYTYAPGHMPGARASAGSWTDSTGRLWVYGGQGYGATAVSGFLDDLWVFDPAQGAHGQWAWMGGDNKLSCQNCGGSAVYGTQYQFAAANSPGGRAQSASWIDSTGRYWLLDGQGANGAQFQDLWVFDPTQGTNGEWAWMGGFSTAGNGSGTYGAEFQFAPGNFPGFRTGAVTWTDKTGRLWLFGGQGFDSTGKAGYLNDLWAFDPSQGTNGEWAWMGGSSIFTQGNGAVHGQFGIYGTEFQFASANMPGGRTGATAQIDKNGKVWLYGGYGFAAQGNYDRLDDFWAFDPAQGPNGQWAWMGGLKTLYCTSTSCTGQPGVYGTEGQFDLTSRPGARDPVQSWMDANGNLWVFGGEGFDSTTNFGNLNDLWEMQFYLSQTITFPPFASSLTYGAAPIVLAATSSSGLPVKYKLISGPATLTSLNNEVLTITGGGASVIITASQAGSALYLPAQSVSRSVWVSKAPLSVRANVRTMLLGGAVPPLTWSTSGFVNFETADTALTGSPTLSTTATSSSPLGQYPITIAANTLTAKNYVLSFRNSSLTVSRYINPKPTITGIWPGYIYAGSAPQNLTITGTNFLSSTIATFDGVSHPITYVNSTTMVLPLTAADQASLALHTIVLGTPLSNGGTATVTLPVLTFPNGIVGLSQLADGDQSRLQRLIQKGRNGQPVTIVALGGSITLGGGASNHAHAYLNLFGNWWKTTFPNSPVTLINSGYAGAGSDYGAVRTPRDALAYNPDLVIVDFAVNDKPLGPTVYGDTFEGIVRQVLDAPNNPALILLFMMRYGEPIALTDNSSESWQGPIGANYNVPMVSYYDAMKPALAHGDLPYNLLFGGTDHPSDVGHAYVAVFLGTMLQNTIDTFPPGATPDPIPATNPPLYSKQFEFTTLIDGIGNKGPQLDPTTNQGWTPQQDWSLVPGTEDLLGKVDEGLQSSTPGSSIDFTVNGTEILFGYWRFHGPMGEVSVSVDGGAPMIVDGFIDAVFPGTRFETRIGTGLAPGNHNVHIQLLSTKNPLSAGTYFRILSIGTGGAQ